MQTLIQQARKRAGMTQEQTAKAMFVGLRQYQRFEYGEQEMTPDEALRLSKILDFPTFTMAYCRRACRGKEGKRKTPGGRAGRIRSYPRQPRPGIQGAYS